jgi:hypothetical protein
VDFGHRTTPELPRTWWSNGSSTTTGQEVLLVRRDFASLQGNPGAKISARRPALGWRQHQRMAFAATAPAAAPSANHFAARAIRRRALPPLAARTAASRSLVSAAVLTLSSFRSACVAVSLAWQALQSSAKS